MSYTAKINLNLTIVNPDKVEEKRESINIAYASDSGIKYKSLVDNINQSQIKLGIKLTAGFGVIISNTQAYMYIKSITQPKIFSNDDVIYQVELELDSRDTSLVWYKIGQDVSITSKRVILLPGDTAVALVSGNFDFTDF